MKSLLDPLWKKGMILKDKQEVQAREMAEKSEALRKTFEESFEQMNSLISQSQDAKALEIYDALILKLKDRQILKSDFRDLKAQLENVSKPLFDRLKEQRDLKKQELAQKATLLDEKKQNLLSQMLTVVTAQEKKSCLMKLFA